MLRIVVMGVSGAGKTTLGARLADRLDARFVDADAAHPPENIEKMSAGVALTDADRRPWLERLRDELAASERLVVTCSALKRAYRDVLRGAGGVRFVHLRIEPDEAAERLATRRGHFMGPSMVAGQFDDLEPPAADEVDVIELDARADVGILVDAILAELGASGGGPSG